jgi:hypothetical protein
VGPVVLSSIKEEFGSVNGPKLTEQSVSLNCRSLQVSCSNNLSTIFVTFVEYECIGEVENKTSPFSWSGKA